MATDRAHRGSRLGFVMAAAGSAVGPERGTPAFLVPLWILRVVAPLAILALLTAVVAGWDFS
jgi:SNF family Na+-dependent transporter